MDSDSPENIVALVHALPYPVAVVRVADGGRLAANPHFYNAFQLTAKAAPVREKPDSDNVQSEKENFLGSSQNRRIAVIDENTIRIEAPGGVRTTVDARVLPVHLYGHDCWSITAPEGGALPGIQLPSGVVSSFISHSTICECASEPARLNVMF